MVKNYYISIYKDLVKTLALQMSSKQGDKKGGKGGGKKKKGSSDEEDDVSEVTLNIGSKMQ